VNILARTKKSTLHTTVQKGRKGGIAMAAGAGALAGAAIGAAAGAMLADDRTRQKVAATLGDLKDQAIDVAGDAREEADSLGTKASRTIAQGKKKLSRRH
jgi:gas vesicle protein